MPKKGKKGSNQKRGKTSGKPSKKPTTVQPEPEQPSTSIEQHEETPLDAADPPSEAPMSVDQQPMPSTSKKPSGVIIKKCEEIEKLAASIQQKCKISPHKKELTVSAENPPESVQELEFLVSEIKKLAQTVGFEITAAPPLPPRPKELTDPIVFYDECSYTWSKAKIRVPHIFLHPPIDFRFHARDVISKDIKMYWPELGTHYTKILCVSFEDHEKMCKYFDDREMPYHTFGHPADIKMKVVIRGISPDVDLDKVKEEMIAASIPVVRFHEMNAKLNRKGKYKSIVVIVPNSEEGKKVLKVKTIFGAYVRVEPPLPKHKQCHRCQKWGHSQRYCRGRVKCLKCAEEHYTSDCNRDPDNEPLRCANCAGEHTANYRKCPHCPDSEEYKEGQTKKLPKKLPRELLTLENCP